MAITDILTSGQQPITTPTAMTTERILPDWYTNYAMDILSGQKAIAGAPYNVFEGARLADFTSDQQAAFDKIRGATGAYAPGLGAAQDTAQGALSRSVAGAAQPYLGAASQSASNTVTDFMNPYSELVAQRVGDLGLRNLNERLLPAIGDQFVGAGGYGGSRQAEAIGRAVRDTQEGISAEQAAVLERGYGQALQGAQSELSRQGALAGTVGQLTQADINAQQTGAMQLGTLAEMQQRLGLTGANALAGSGALQQGFDQQNMSTAYEDFLRQQGYPQEQIDNMTKTMKGVSVAVPTAQTEMGYKGTGEYTPSTLSTIGSGASTIAGILAQLGVL